jgi:hypothetical protein
LPRFSQLRSQPNRRIDVDVTTEYARLATRTRWAFEALSEVATTLLEMERSDLSAETFELELKVAELHAKLLKLLQNAPALPVRKDPSERLDHFVLF